MRRATRWTSDRLIDRDALDLEERPRLLLLCDYRPHEAATVLDHIEAIRRWSRADVFILPMFGDLPDELDLGAFDGLLIHYNVVMSNPAYLSPLARWRISQFGGVKGAFIQDEYRFVNRTRGVLRTLGINVLFTCVPQDQVGLVYPAAELPELSRTVTVLTGYVPDDLASLPARPYGDRVIDVAYRGRRLPPWLGRLAQEKSVIADRFAADAPAYGLAVDISCREEDRLYGRSWIDFISRSKAMLGVESGASVFDFDGSIEQSVLAHLAAHPETPFDELHRIFLADADGRIRLNQISPRCFEAAALGTLMVLYPGEYSGILEPWRHYVPLQKDHSNMDEVVHAIRERDTWERITTLARQEVALNPSNSFRTMVAAVDEGLDLTITARQDIHAATFERVASKSFAGMPMTRLHALGLPPSMNRVRLLASRAPRVLTPSSLAISVSPGGNAGWLHALRERVGHVRALAYWAIRPRALPWSLLLRHGDALPRELGELGRLQVSGARARAAGARSPFVLIVAAVSRELRIVLPVDVPARGRSLQGIPGDLTWASRISLHISDPWLVPVGIGDVRSRPLVALSAVMRARPDVARRLLVGREPWCDVVQLDE